MLHDTYELSISSQAGDRRQATTWSHTRPTFYGWKQYKMNNVSLKETMNLKNITDHDGILSVYKTFH